LRTGHEVPRITPFAIAKIEIEDCGQSISLGNYNIQSFASQTIARKSHLGQFHIHNSHLSYRMGRTM
jgi:hypothetical protein